LTRMCFQHALGGIYLIAFLIAANQFIPLLGARGLQPVRLFVRHVPFRRAPSLFYINCSDCFIAVMIWCGVGLSCFALTGFSESFGLGASMMTWALLWIIYLSLVNVGQTFYGFGWETMLAETGFLAIFSVHQTRGAGHRDVADRVGAFPHDVRSARQDEHDARTVQLFLSIIQHVILSEAKKCWMFFCRNSQAIARDV
jgi:hypothetical protein